MKITLTSTPDVVSLANGSKARVWNGSTEGGVPVQALVAGLAIEPADEARFRAELDVDDQKAAPMPAPSAIADDAWSMADTLKSAELSTGATQVLGWMWRQAELRHRVQALITMALTISHRLAPIEHIGLVERLRQIVDRMRTPGLVEAMRAMAPPYGRGAGLVELPPGHPAFTREEHPAAIGRDFERALCLATCHAGMSKDDLFVTLTAAVGYFLANHSLSDEPTAAVRAVAQQIIDAALQAREHVVRDRRDKAAKARLRAAEVQGHA